MKKLAVLSLLACLVLPVGAQAADYGVYVAPKFAVGIQHNKYRIASDDVGFLAPWKNFSSTEAVVGGALAIGYDFSVRFDVPVRAELEYSLFGNSSKHRSIYEDLGGGTHRIQRVEGKTRIQSLFVNVYYDFKNSTSFTPYVGAGLGLGFVNTKGYWDTTTTGVPYERDNYGSNTRTNFAWNIGLGVAYAFNDNFSVDLGYRYAQFGKGRANNAYWNNNNNYGRIETRRNNMHQFMLSARVTF